MYLHEKNLTILLVNDPVIEPVDDQVTNAGESMQNTEDNVIGLKAFN